LDKIIKLEKFDLHCPWTTDRLLGGTGKNPLSALTRGPDPVTHVHSIYSQMSTKNRFQALAEVDDEQLPQVAETHPEDAPQTQSDEEGWDEEIDFSDGEDSEQQGAIEDGHRRRKVSSGPRDAPNPNMMFTFPLASTRPMVPGRGRGGGLVVQPCEHTGILRALIKHPQGNLEEIQQKTLQSTQEEPGGRQDRKAQTYATERYAASRVPLA
jgi:hypothetical protein